MSKWNEIISEQDVAKFLELYDGFHDSCLKELKYVSGAFVNQDFAMYPINDQRKLYIIFQRQNPENSVVELEFSALESLNIKPIHQTYTCEIHDVSMYLENGKIYWADSVEFKRQKETYDGTWVCAEKVRWRIIDEYIGNKLIY